MIKGNVDVLCLSDFISCQFLFDLSDRILGKYYFEAVVTDEGLCRVGWATLKAKLELGTDKEGFGFGGTGKKSFGRQFDSYGEVIEKISQFKGKFSFSLESRKAGPLDERQTTNLFTYKKTDFFTQTKLYQTQHLKYYSYWIWCQSMREIRNHCLGAGRLFILFVY